MLFEGTSVLLTHELHESIRRAEIAAARSSLEAALRLRPSAGFAAIDVAGGFARFMGSASPMSRVFGAGALAPVTPDDVATITAFFESRGGTPSVFVWPLAHPTLALELAAAGYAPVNYDNVLVSDDFESHAARDERIRVASDIAAWARASAAAFADRDIGMSHDDFVGTVVAHTDGVCALEAIDDGQVVATAAMSVHDGSAAFFATSTLPAHRGRGWHTALIADRIARARNTGALFMRAAAEPGSTSERNFKRCGFETLFTRSLWQRQVVRT
jgi:GNAT superfamily N-acetyltransferase